MTYRSQELTRDPWNCFFEELILLAIKDLGQARKFLGMRIQYVEEKMGTDSIKKWICLR